ncbi:MAG TPA: carcinine hydrolase/isopenicillin-N N-acyltransferase family protein [Desulfomonilia bacterium]
MKRSLTVLLFICVGLAGCGRQSGIGQNSDNGSINENHQVLQSQLNIPEMLTAQGLTLLDSVKCTDRVSGNTYTGYLAAFDGAYSEGTNASGQHVGLLPKYCLVLRGSSYCMGYQMGYLLPAGTQQMTGAFIDKAAEALTGIKSEDFPELYNFLKGQVRILCEEARPVILDYLEDEMAGMEDGATAHGYKVDARDVMLMNEGFDAMYAILSTGVMPMTQKFADILNGLRAKLTSQKQTVALKRLDESVSISGGRIIFPNADPYIMGCNEFVVSGNSTVGGEVYHGRDFMFVTGDIYQDVACMAVYLPEEGHPFIAVSTPGYVGHPTAVNDDGLSMGVDVVRGACTRSTPGMGSLFVFRDIMQNSASLDEAVARMKAMDRGVSWLYVIADDDRSVTYMNGLVVEEGRSDPPYTGPYVMPVWNQVLLWPLINKLKDEPLPDRGMLIRDQSWIYPDEFKNISIGYMNGDEMNYLLYFPDQMESWPDVVVTANNYVIPRMVFTTYNPGMILIKGKIKTTVFRYNKMVEMIGNDYGNIDYEKAREIIDFMNPNRNIDNLKRYKIGGPVEGHHAIIDNRARTVKALFGYYGDWAKGVDDSWVRLDLKPFAEWLHSTEHGE